MKYLKLIFIVIFFYTGLVYIGTFNSRSWKKNSDVNKLGLRRQLMIDDLVENILKKGMTKSEVIELLGEPYYDGIQCRLPEGIVIPDSVKVVHSSVKSNEEWLIEYARYKKWSKANCQPYTILRYPAGFSLIDQNFLTFKLDGNNLVRYFRVEQH